MAWPADLELAKAWYLPQLERMHDDAQVRKLDVDQLVRLAAGYGSRERFLTELTLDPPQSTSDQIAAPPLLDEDYLILSTIHSAKGQEWKAVHVLNVVDGCIPSDMATGSTEEIEEERRLLYVAMTRAKEHLHLIVPHRFYVTQQARRRRPAHVRGPHALHHRSHGREVRAGHLARGRSGRRHAAAQPQAPLLQVRARARAAWR